MNLDTLIAFNDEISALTRAGIPLGYGLLRIKSGLAGRLRELTAHVGQRLELGEPMDHVLADPRFPAWYSAVVVAGIQSGKLSAALESVAPMLRRQADLRRFAFGAISYPVMVCCLAGVFFTLLFRQLFDQLEMLCQFQSMEMPKPLRGLLQAANWLVPFVPWVVGLALLALVLAWIVSGRALASLNRFDRYVPGLSGIVRNGRTAVFLDVLSLMLEARLPTAKALLVAADATGNRSLRRDVQRIAVRLEEGQTDFGDFESLGGLPPLVAWSLLNDQQPSSWIHSVRGLRDAYYDRVRVYDDVFRQFFPALAMLFLAGSATVAFCLLTLGPFYTLLRALAGPASGS